jgi:uncharacterized coiled-coil protein SlyX
MSAPEKHLRTELECAFNRLMDALAEDANEIEKLKDRLSEIENRLAHRESLPLEASEYNEQ